MTKENSGRKLKLIWDFRGPDAIKIAEHHALHLDQYIMQNELSLHITGVEEIQKEYALAFMVVTEEEMRPVRDSLKPHRGQVYEP